MRKLIILLLLFYSIQSFGQNPVLIKGYVIDDNQVLPEISVSVAGKKIETETNFKGQFKIQCALGDTLVFEKKYSHNYKIEKYVIIDSLMVIVKLIAEVRINDHGMELGSVRSYKSSIKHSFQFSSSFMDRTVINIGYNYYMEPFFSDKPYIPIQNSVSFGMNISSYNETYYLFPNIGFDIRNNYSFGHNPTSYFSFFVPSVKIGYWLNDFKPGKSGFGYELGINLVHFSIKRLNLFIAGNYNNYLTPDGTFMLSLNFFTMSKVNKIPKFIQKKISK